ncbi:MAG: hypothetical protein WCS72_16655, partial [Deltaproteobacteria bacterium]
LLRAAVRRGQVSPRLALELLPLARGEAEADWVAQAAQMTVREAQAAVRRAESASTGQVVPVVVERSEPYEEARWIAAVIGAALATAIVELVVDDPSVTEVLVFQVVAGVVGWFVGRLASVERLLAGRRHQAHAVHARAEQAFLEHGLHQTRQ